MKKSGHKTGKPSIKKIDDNVQIMGLTISGTHRIEVLRKIWLQRKEMLHVATVNPEYVMRAREDENFAKVLQKCLTVADGWGVVWGHKLMAHGTWHIDKCELERISGTWLAEQIVAHAERAGEKVFLLGAQAGVAELAASRLRGKFPQLQISWYEGAKTIALEKNEEASMTIAKINAYEPDYLLVAYGMPYQDLWIEENRPYLRVRVAMGVGGVFDEWAGKVVLCPPAWDQVGLKWLWRLMHEPWRGKRILKVLQFGALVLYHKLID